MGELRDRTIAVEEVQSEIWQKFLALNRAELSKIDKSAFLICGVFMKAYVAGCSAHRSSISVWRYGGVEFYRMTELRVWGSQ